MLSRMSSKELAEWMAFEGLEPFGYMAEFAGHAQTAQVLANIHRNPKKTKAFSTEDFMPKKKKEQTTEEMIQVASMLTQLSGGKDKR